MENKLSRPTNVAREKYSAFVNKCRQDCKEPREVMEKLMVLYVKKGQTLIE